MEVSRVELDDGQVVTVEHPEEWSENKILAFARLNKPEAKRTEAASGTDNKDDDISTTDLVKLGLSRFAVQFIPDTFLMSNGEFIKQLEEAKAGRVEYAGAVQERQAREMAGIPQEAQLGLGQEIIAGLADPLTLTGTPIRSGVTAAAKSLIPAAVSTAAGTTAGVVAPQVAAELGAGQLGQELAGVFAGASTGITTGGIATAGVTTGLKVLGDVKNKVVGGDTGTLGVASEAMSNSAVKAEINRIKNTTDATEIARAVENLASIKEEIPDLEIGGIVATLAENPIARDWIRKTTQNNKGFQKEIAETLARDSAKVAERFDKLLGESEEIGRPLIEGVSRTAYKKIEDRLRTTVERQTENIDKVLNGLTAKTLGKRDEFEIGQTANKLLDRKESQVRQAANKLYAVAKKQGAKVSLPDEQIMSVYSQFRNVRLSDIFGPESATAKKLETNWSPKEVDGVMEFPEVTGNDLISLKKAMNREVSDLTRVGDRTATQNQKLSMLYHLKEVVTTVLNKEAVTSPQFVKAIRAADAFYYKELGLPLSAEGLREINAKKFESGAAVSLMTYEKARDYVNFVGKQGMAVVRHAVRMKAEKAGVVNPSGQIDANRLDTFRRKNARLIEFTGLGQEFTDTSSKLRTINNTQARHNQAYKEKTRELSQGFFKAITDKNLSTVVSEMISSPATRKKYLAEISKLGQKEKDMVLTGIRQEFLSQGLSTKGTMQEFINKNSEAVADIFEPSYVKNINKMAELKDLMQTIGDLMKDSLGQTPVIDTIQDLTGVSIAEYAGTFRNQILSTERKIIHIVTKATTTSGKDKFYTKSAEVLLDPDVVNRLANPPKDDMKTFVKETLEGAGDYLKTVGTYYTDTLKDYLNLSTIRSVTAAEDVPVEQEIRQ
jgi:hypothetical protein